MADPYARTIEVAWDPNQKPHIYKNVYPFPIEGGGLELHRRQTGTSAPLLIAGYPAHHYAWYRDVD